jgi:hypothetical protein
MIPTVQKLEIQGRKLDRINGRVARTLELMRRGACLHFDQSGRRPRYWLSTGQQIDEETAALLVKHRSVVSVGDALFAGTPAQTYRYAEEVHTMTKQTSAKGEAR